MIFAAGGKYYTSVDGRQIMDATSGLCCVNAGHNDPLITEAVAAAGRDTRRRTTAMAGCTGVLLPPKGYLKRLRELCDRHGILLIFDEVITAYGRLGATSAAKYFGVKPGIITTAKGVTNGVVPMGAVIVDAKIHAFAMERADTPIELFHG